MQNQNSKKKDFLCKDHPYPPNEKIGSAIESLVSLLYKLDRLCVVALEFGEGCLSASAIFLEIRYCFTSSTS